MLNSVQQTVIYSYIRMYNLQMQQVQEHQRQIEICQREMHGIREDMQRILNGRSFGSRTNITEDAFPLNLSRFRNLFTDFSSDVHQPPLTTQQISQAIDYVSFNSLTNPSSDRCPIGLDIFQPNQIVAQIRHCGHIFERRSLLDWLRNHDNCPVCRHNIRTQMTHETSGQRNAHHADAHHANTYAHHADTDGHTNTDAHADTDGHADTDAHADTNGHVDAEVEQYITTHPLITNFIRGDNAWTFDLSSNHLTNEEISRTMLDISTLLFQNR